MTMTVQEQKKKKKKGTWGKSKVQRRKRHYITNPEQRNIILKKLGRYIGK